MACIDKTYVDADQLKEAIAWVKKVSPIQLENGLHYDILYYVKSYNDIDDPDFDWNRDQYILWNTPIWFDRWLWVNCPLDFIRRRLQVQYDDATLDEFKSYVYHNPKDNLKFGCQHYTFLDSPIKRGHGYKNYMRIGGVGHKNPYLNGLKQSIYYMRIDAPKNSDMPDLKYNAASDTWEEAHGMMPASDDYVWQYYKKRIPNEKSIIRELRRWYIPSGYIVSLKNFTWRGMDFKILVK